VRYVKYTSGYRYQLEEDFQLLTDLRPLQPGGNRWASLDDLGILRISAGYAWDGASGPAVNTKNFVRGSLVHDALYQLIRAGVLQYEDRKRADEILREIVLEDGMWHLRAWWVYTAVRLFGGSFMRAHDAGVLTAP
jgi:hypothetical protein